MPVGDRVLVVRLDSMGDVLLAGPAVRAVSRAGRAVTLLCSSRGAPAAELLPGVDDVIVFDAAWVLADPAPFRAAPVRRLLRRLRRSGFDQAVVLVSDHQSPLPIALLLRLAGVRRITAASHDYPGALLDVRVALPPDLHEAQRSTATAVAAGFAADGDHLEVARPLVDVRRLTGRQPFVVIHPGADAPARAWPATHAREAVRRLVVTGQRVLVTGGRAERDLTAFVSGAHGVDLGGRTSLRELAAVLASAAAVVVGNSGPAHLAAAVGTPVVSLFSPVVPSHRWRPYGVPHVLLGDQSAACAGTRARACPFGDLHPCLSQVTPEEVVAAVRSLSVAVA